LLILFQYDSVIFFFTLSNVDSLIFVLFVGMTDRWTSTELTILNQVISVYGIDDWNAIKRDIRFGPSLLKRTARELFEKYNFDAGCIKAAAVFSDTVHSMLLRDFSSPLLPLDHEYFVDDGLPIKPWWYKIWQPAEVVDDDVGYMKICEINRL
jgi:hypothetical protein